MKRVLIVEDELDLCTLLQGYLQKKHYSVRLAHSLKEGIGEVSSFAPDLLILDNNLPDGMGWSEVNHFIDLNPDMKIILMSAFKSMHEAEVNSSIVKVLEKPIRLSDIDASL